MEPLPGLLCGRVCRGPGLPGSSQVQRARGCVGEMPFHMRCTPLGLPALEPGCCALKRCDINSRSYSSRDDSRKDASVSFLALSVQRHYLNPVVREPTVQGYASPYYLLRYLYLISCTLAPSDKSGATHAISTSLDEGWSAPAGPR